MNSWNSIDQNKKRKKGSNFNQVDNLDILAVAPIENTDLFTFLPGEAIYYSRFIIWITFFNELSNFINNHLSN